MKFISDLNFFFIYNFDAAIRKIVIQKGFHLVFGILPGDNAKSRELSIEKKIEFLESLAGKVSFGFCLFIFR